MSSRTLAIGLGLAHCTDCRKRRSRALLGRIDGVTDEGKIFDSLSQDNCAIWTVRYGAMHSKLVPGRSTSAVSRFTFITRPLGRQRCSASPSID